MCNCYNFICTAGGLAALINVDFLRRKLSSVKTLHAILDAMLFVDSQDINGFHSMQDLLRKSYYLHNVNGQYSIGLFFVKSLSFTHM